MTPLDYLLILEGLILVCAGIFWCVGRIFGRGNPNDDLRRIMGGFWNQIIWPTQMQSMPPLVGESDEASQAVEELAKPAPGKKGKNVDTDVSKAVSMLNIKVVPGTEENRIVGRTGDLVTIEVTVPPEEGAANKIATDLLAKMLGLPAFHIKLVRGHYDSRKLLQISTLSPAQLEEKLANLS